MQKNIGVRFLKTKILALFYFKVQLLLRQLSKRFGQIGDRHIQIINKLELEQLDELGEALLDFTDSMELDNWLQSRIAE
jgi:t-SNARE complex subunit (syntaxin)